MRGDNHMSRKRKSIISLVTVVVLSMCLALPVFAKTEARLPAGICEKCGEKAAMANGYTYGPWKNHQQIWHDGHYDIKYIRTKYLNVKCGQCGYLDKYEVGHEEKVTCPN